jgi:hypothetical protein
MQISTKLDPQDTIRKVFKCTCLNYLLVVHIDVICMIYDQKKGHESNWELFDSRPQVPRKKRLNEVRLECVIHPWKDIFKDYKIFSSNFQNKIDLRYI